MEASLRTRRKKKMSGELATDAGLTAQEEIKRVMKSALDAIIHGLRYSVTMDHSVADMQ